MAATSDPVATIRAEIEAWDDPVIERDIFATVQAEKIFETVDGFCRRELGSGIAAYLFMKSSIGSAHGVRLADGRKVVFKARIPAAVNPGVNADAESLTAICRVMTWLNDRGYPCARPLAGPLPLGRGFATVEDFLDRGGHADGLDPRFRKAIAAGLAELVETLRGVGFDTSCLTPFFRGAALYPQPHSKIFDFEKTAKGAEWIDDFAARARALEDDDPATRVLGHGDWRVEHLRFEGETIVATYDWDSLAWMPEAGLIASAAYSYPTDWSREDRPVLPRAEDMLAFVADYEDARGRAFSERERRSLLAHCVYSVAYGARCSHALAPDTMDWPEYSRPFILRADGDRLLRMATR